MIKLETTELFMIFDDFQDFIWGNKKGMFINE